MMLQRTEAGSLALEAKSRVWTPSRVTSDALLNLLVQHSSSPHGKMKGEEGDRVWTEGPCRGLLHPTLSAGHQTLESCW